MSNCYRSGLGRVRPNGQDAKALNFNHPDDVLNDTQLSMAEKRALLAAWASDACAVPNLPMLRQLDSGAIVALDTVLAALRHLDDAAPQRRPSLSVGPHRRHSQLTVPWRRALLRHHDHDDDDPPPSPAAALPPGVEIELRRRRDTRWVGAAA